MSVAVGASAIPVAETGKNAQIASSYPTWFYLPAAIIYGVLFLFPTVASLFFSLTRWTLFEAQFIGLENFVQFFREPFLVQGLVNTLIYGVVTSGAKVILGTLLALLLTSDIIGRGYLRSVVFFPVLVSTVGVGITFTVMMHPTQGVINETLALFGIKGPGWLTDPKLALLSVALVDVWKGVGLATLIYIAGIVSIPRDYFEASKIDGASAWQNFWEITLPLLKPATVTVVILSLIGGLRSFDLIWAMTRGGPVNATHLMATLSYQRAILGGYLGEGSAIATAMIPFLLGCILISWFGLQRRKWQQGEAND